MTKPRMVITGGSGLLALNWACAMRERWDVILGTHLHDVALQGVRSCRIDLGNAEHLKSQLDGLSPDLVVHTAGLTDVDRCESAPDLAILVNATLAENVARVAAAAGYGLVHISTDHLFAGDGGPFAESDVPRPLNEYARSKLKGEELVREAHPEALVLRTNFFGWGHAGRQSFSDWIIRSLRRGEAISLFEDVHFTPILADALAMAAHELVAAGCIGTFNLVGDDRVSKYEFGLRLARRFALPIELIRCAQIGHASLRARRPNDMSLSNAKARDRLGRGLGSLDDYFDALDAQERQGRSAALLHAVSG